MELQISVPDNIKTILNAFIEKCTAHLREDLVSIILFGSAAEGRLRPTSDVNLMLVLRTFEKEKMDPIREDFRVAHAAIHLNVMFILETEVAEAAQTFAVKFHDIKERHVLLYGKNIFASLQINRENIKSRLKQDLLNLSIRLRERYALISLREEQLALVIANFSGPVRASAAALLDLQGKKYSSPKDALLQLADSSSLKSIINSLSEAREQGMTSTHKPNEVLFGLIEIANLMLRTCERI